MRRTACCRGLLLGSVFAGAIVSSATGPLGKTGWNQVWLIGSSAAMVATVLAGAAIAILPLSRLRKRDARADKRDVANLSAAERLAEAIVDA